MKRQNVETSKRRNMMWHRLLAGAVSAAALCIVAVFAGCAHINNPYEDSSAVINEEMTTPSTQGYMAEGKSVGRPLGRTWSSSEVTYANGAVTHWPLWFEDPFEDQGNRYLPVADPSGPDNVFCWNWVDYLHIGYGPGRELVNIGGFPASVVVTPPGTLMESDGRLSKSWMGDVFDPTRSDSATREPPHVNAISRQPYTHDEVNEPVQGTQPVEH